MKNDKKRSVEELWIGLAKVEPSSPNSVLTEAESAFTNVIGIAGGRLSFRRKISEALCKLGLKLIRLEDAETVQNRVSKYSLDAELSRAAKVARKTGQVTFGTFHTFLKTR